MKKLISALLITALLGSGACFAADTSANAVTVSLENIEQLWTDHSPEYLKIKSDLSIAKSSYNKLSDSADDMQEAVFYDSTGLLYAMYSSIASSRDQAKLAYDLATLQYDQKIQNAVLAAKQAFLTCRQDELNLNSLKASLEQKQAQLGRYADGVSKGYISQKTYDTLKGAVSDLQNSLAGLETKRDTDLLTLKTKLGIGLDAELNLVYPDLSGDFFLALEDLDPEADLAAVLSGSLNLKALQLTYDSLNFPAHTYVSGAQIDGAKLSLQTAKTTVEAGYKTLYQGLMTQYADLKNSRRSLSDEKDKLDKLQAQYDRGFASSLTLSNLTLEYTSMAASAEVKQCTLYGTYLTYLNMVAGN